MLNYIDSVILIYQFDYVGPLQVRAIQWLSRLNASGDEFAISDLVRMECRIGPLRSGDRARLAIFEGFFALPNLQVIPLNSAVFDRAADIRANYSFKTPDSIHLAAAVEAGCDRFLTHDTRLARFTRITVEILP